MMKVSSPYPEEVAMAHPRILAFVLAGGKGERLATAYRLPFRNPQCLLVGRNRIVDFVLSNLVNSRTSIQSICWCSTKSQSLIEHRASKLGALVDEPRPFCGLLFAADANGSRVVSGYG